MRAKKGHAQERVYGPELMLKAIETAVDKNLPVGFLGGSPEVIELLDRKIKSKFSDLQIAYSYSPPFRPLTPDEDSIIVNKINASGARILFVGLGCPKQEIWMAEHRGRINTVMLGVGAAFDFLAGSKLQAPAWMQNIGLEWLFRLVTEPRRLWSRYFYHNPRFIALAIADLLGLIR